MATSWFGSTGYGESSCGKACLPLGAARQRNVGLGPLCHGSATSCLGVSSLERVRQGPATSRLFEERLSMAGRGEAPSGVDWQGYLVAWSDAYRLGGARPVSVGFG